MKKCMKCGGMKKMQTGGASKQPRIYGIPQTGGTGPAFAKKGGSFAPNRPVMESCKNGMVRDENGRCVMERKMAKGGSTSFGMLSVKAGIDKNPKPTAADRIAGAKMKSKMKAGGAKKTLVKAEFGRGVVSSADGSTYTKTGKKIGTGIGKKAEYRDFTTGEGDRSFTPTVKGFAEKMKLRAANKKAVNTGTIQSAKKGGAVIAKKKK